VHQRLKAYPAAQGLVLVLVPVQEWVRVQVQVSAWVLVPRLVPVLELALLLVLVLVYSWLSFFLLADAFGRALGDDFNEPCLILLP
jgi:hypothetical protein